MSDGITRQELSEELKTSIAMGSIVEKGSNDNGVYVKYADGTMSCYIKNLEIIGADNVYAQNYWTFPAIFTYIPVVIPVATIKQINGAGKSTTLHSLYVVNLSQSGGNVRVVEGGIFDDKTLYRVSCHAIGEWK
ncbi:hypothetical protein NSA47_02315 [Irregularibacter muris]|uniref:Uncharacterized protein n=1 Tax=Irregularibacter muris TaxID=1796619 RepID=A0AAE3HCH1_9FIRM|nr:hypothetical protein [Irregularibacter muris]MCR1897822.1 hypothetical protein [Irregularibacter muris]